MNKKIIKSLSALALAMLLPMSIAAKENIIELNITGQPPLNTDNQAGFMDEISKEAFRRIGYQLKTIRLPAARGLVNANRGIIDGEMSRVQGIENSYKNLVRVPEKIMDWSFVGFSRQTITLENGWEDLSNKSVAYIGGWKPFEKNVPDTAEINIINNTENLFNLLRRKRIDIVLYECWGGHYTLHKMKIKGVQVHEKPLAVKKMFIYLHKKHQALVPLLANEIMKMKQDGSYKKLFNKHLKPLNDHAGIAHDKHL